MSGARKDIKIGKEERLHCQNCHKDFNADDVCPHCGCPFIMSPPL